MKTLRLIFLAVYLSLSLTGFSQTVGIGVYTATTATGTDTYTATVTPTFSSYLNGQRFQITFPNANTGPATININAKGAEAILNSRGVALVGGEISAGETIIMVYNASNMYIITGGDPEAITATQIQNALGYTPATSSDIETFVDAAITDLLESGQTDMTSTEIVGLLVNDPDALQLLAPALEPYFTAPIAIPEFLGVPVIGGVLSYPNTLTATPATFTGQNVVTTWQWERDGTPISGATSITYALQVADQTNDITVVQTATNSAGADVAESIAATIAGAADSSPPTITSASVTGITSTSFTVNIETDEVSNHYYIVIENGSTNPTEAQIIAGIDYGAVTVIAAGNANGTITNQSTQQVTNLTASTSYEIHKVARDAALNISAIDSDAGVSTLAAEDWIPMPDIDAFSASAVTISAAVVGSSLEASELSGQRDVLIPTTFAQRLRLNQLVGTTNSKYRFKSVSDAAYSTIGGDIVAASQQAIGTLGGSNHLVFEHLLVVGNSNPAVGGISGVNVGPNAAGGIFDFTDVRFYNFSFAGMLINNNALDQTYTITAKFVVSYGYAGTIDGGEGTYWGNTGGQHSRHVNSVAENIFVGEKRRDGIQDNNSSNKRTSKFTIVNVGTNTAGTVGSDQRNHLQIQNSTGVWEDFIAWGAPRAWNIFAHGVTIQNGTFYITGPNTTGARSYIGKASTNYPGSPQLTGEDIIFYRCHFDSQNAVDYYTTVVEDEVNVYFIECTKGANVANIFFDNRADKVTKTLSHTGTTTASTPPAPTFVSLDITNREDFGKLDYTAGANSYYRNLGQGYRTLTPTSAVVTTPADQAQSIVFSNVDHDSFTATWTESTDADGTLVLVKSGGAVDATPSDDVNYSASPTFGSGSELGTGNFVVYKSTSNTVDVEGLTPSTTYHVRLFSHNGTGSDVKFITSTSTGNPASQATTAAPAFNPFTDITWDTELDNSTAEADLASGIWSNAGADGDATVVLSSPTWDAGKQAVNFVKASNQRFTIQAAGSYVFNSTSDVVDTWFTIHTPTSWSGSAHTIAGFSNTHRIAASTSGLLVISGENTATTLSLDTDYTIRVLFNGTASTYTINNGTPIAVSLSTNSMGTPNWRLGSNFANSEHWSGWIKYVFVSDAGLTSQNVIDMWDWSGNYIFLLPFSSLFRRRRKEEYKIAA